MKKTTLHDKHVKLGAKMVPYADYEMPIYYTSLTEEHMAVRKCVGLFDVSHMGEFIIKGKEALDFVQYVTSNDVRKLAIGEAQYSCLPRPEGGIVDDLIVYRLPEDKCNEGEQAFMLVVNAANIEKDWNWIASHNDFNATMENISFQTSLLALQGPKAIAVLKKLTDVDVENIKFYHFVKGVVAEIPQCIISATGYTGAGGFELYVRNEDVGKLWDELVSAGAEFQLLPCGLAARDTLRLEMGYCLYGNEIDDTTNTIEAGLSWITKFTDDAFLGKDYLKEVKSSGTDRKLVAFTLEGRRIPRHGYKIINEEGQEIGIVTSGTMSPCLEVPIGLGYVKMGYHKVGQTILVQYGNKTGIATITKLPFYRGS